MKEKVVINLTQVGKKISKSTNRADKIRYNRSKDHKSINL